MIPLSFVIFRNEQKKQQTEEEIHGRKTSNISMVIKERFSMSFKAVANQHFTVEKLVV